MKKQKTREDAFNWILENFSVDGAAGRIISKKMCTERTANYTRADRTAIGHEVKVRYIARITV